MTLQSSLHFRCRAALAALASFFVVAPAGAATVSWAVDADGAWNNAANWSGAAVPTIGDTVIIDRPSGLYTITVPTGSHAAFSIHSNERLVLDAGTLTVAETLQVSADLVLDGTTLIGAIVSPGANGEGMDAIGGALNGVTMNADLDVSGPTTRSIDLSNGLTLNGTAFMGNDGGLGRFIVNGSMTIDGTGEIVLGSSSSANGILVGFGASVIVESGIEIHGARGTIGTNSAGRKTVLRGPVTAEVSGQRIALEGDSLLIEAPVTGINGGSIELTGRPFIRDDITISGGGELEINGTSTNEALLTVGTGCTLDMNGTWVNLGMIRPTDANVFLGGTFPWSAVGDFVRVGGTVTVDGTLDNTGNALTLDANTGTWTLAGTLLSGSVEPGLGGAEFRYASNATLNGVTVNADMDLSEAGTLQLNLVNGLTLNATAFMGNDGGLGRFIVNGSMTIDGTGEIVLGSSSSSNGILVGFGASVIVESGIEIHGARGTIGTNSAGRKTVLRGPVTAEVSGQRIALEGDSLLIEAPVTGINGGSIELTGRPFIRDDITISGGGELEINGTSTNEALLTVGTGCTLDMNGTWVNLGMIRPTDATVTLGGTFPWSAVGDFVRVGGTVTVDGTLDNTGNALTLDANTGTWTLAGTLLSGSVEPGLGGAEFRYASNATLNGVTVNADMDMSEAGTLQLNLVNGLTLNATALMGHDGALGRFIVSTPQTIDGTGEMFLGKSSASNGVLVGFGGTITIGPDLTIRGARGEIGTNAAGRTTTILGTVRADSAGFAIELAGSEVNNQGTVHAAGGNIQNGGPFVNTGLLQVDAAASFTGNSTVVQDAGATIVAAGGTFTRPWTMNGGTLSGGGSFTNTVTVNGGTIAPGASPGLLSGTSTFAQSDGALAIEIAGADPADYDRLSFGTSAALAGSLGVGFLDSFLPAIGDTFTIVAAPVVSGAYAPVQLPAMIPSQRWLVDPAADAYRLIVEFNPPPVPVAGDTTLVADAACEAGVLAAALDDGTTDPNGDPFTFALSPPGPYGVGAHVVQFVATDSLGAADSVAVTITVVNAPPVAAAQNIAVPSNAACEADVSAAQVDDGTSDPEGQPFGLALSPPGPYPVGDTPVLFIATDACGAADTTQITITVLNAPPVAAGRDTTLIGAPPAHTADVDPAALDDGSSDPAGQALTFALVPAGPYGIGTHIVQFVANDACGASDTTTVTIDVVNSPPMAMCNDTTLVANLACEGDVTPEGIDDGSADPEGGALTFALEPPPPYAIGVHAVLFIATDGLGNADTCNTTITVINNAPLASARDTTIVGQPPAWMAAVSAADVDSFTSDPDGHGFTLALEPPGPYGLGTHPVAFIATDDCGAADTTYITIAVINNPPVAMGRDTTLLVVIDSCSVGMDPAALDDGSSDPEGAPVTFALDPPPPYGIGVHPVSLIVTDDCGASDTTGVTITVTNSKPVAVAVAQLILNSEEANCEASADPSAFDDGSSDGDGHALTFSAVPPAPYPFGTTQVLFIASDGCESDTVSTEVIVECPLASNDGGPLPVAFAVGHAAPNPFQGMMRVRLSLPDTRRVTAHVFDVAGRRVADLVDRTMAPGHWDIEWNGRGDDGTVAGAGIYLVRIHAGEDLVVRRISRVR